MSQKFRAELDNENIAPHLSAVTKLVLQASFGSGQRLRTELHWYSSPISMGNRI